MTIVKLGSVACLEVAQAQLLPELLLLGRIPVEIDLGGIFCLELDQLVQMCTSADGDSGGGQTYRSLSTEERQGGAVRTAEVVSRLQIVLMSCTLLFVLTRLVCGGS